MAHSDQGIVKNKKAEESSARKQFTLPTRINRCPVKPPAITRQVIRTSQRADKAISGCGSGPIWARA
jgi:hypothetical protein